MSLIAAVPVDPWRAVSPQPPPRPVVDPWSPSTNTDHSSPGSPRGVLTSPDGGDLDEFDIISTRERPSQSTLLISNANNLNNNGGTLTPDPFDLNMLGDSLTDEKQSNLKKTPQSFLGENSALVNLDNLVTVSAKPTSTTPVPGFVEFSWHLFNISYNATQIRTRNCVECTIGVWKRRFRCLTNTFETTLAHTSAIITATSVLHNIARRMNDDLPEDEFPWVSGDVEFHVAPACENQQGHLTYQ
uniref:DDE Tnp4 domain-containing protein n=1 Tax=Timema shepardi TaxID=629360 RepID=A0A7R9AZ26_TIMSH|nr:unnamed protein product [Timema shepardi]